MFKATPAQFGLGGLATLGAAGAGFFLSKEKKKAQNKVETFKSQDIKDWDKFTENTARKSFVQELGKDPMTDPKLLMYADNMNRLKTGSKVQDISGDGGKSYQITKLRGSNRLGCTCNDWRYKRSVAQPGEEQDCKHIKQYRQMSKTAASDKAPRLTFITGGAGAGKSTMAKQLIDSGEFDVLIGTDTGGVVNGQYVKPSKAEREKIRKDREALALKMRAKGKRVLVEGFPRGVLSYPKLLAQADDVLYLDTPMLTRLFRVGKRSRERGTPMLPDLKMGLTTHFDDLKYRKEIEEKSPNFRPIRTYEDAKKEAMVYTSDAMKKEGAELISPLKPHQERVLQKLENSDGVIVAHRVGAGKTLTSIAAAVKSGKPIEVVTPASLTPNFEKELKKHVRGEVQARIRSYEKVTRESKDGKGIDPTRFLILDEAHRLRNSGTDTASAIRPVAAKAHKRLLLTGTAIYNQPADIAPLANIAAGSTVLPQDESAFNARFIRETEIKPGLLQRLRGVKPGIKKTLQNQSELENALSGRIDLHDEASIEDFPVQIDERIHVPMSNTQKDVYDTLMNAAPLHIRLKIKSGLPPSKQEARNLNAFVTGTRQASLSPRPYAKQMTDEEEVQNTPKIQEAVRRLAQMRAADKRFRGVVYSNYIDAGLHPYEKALERQKIPFETLTGSLSAKKKAELVSNYNSGKTPVLLVSSSGTEGLDLKGTKLVQVLEPHWNNSKIDQVIGRGVRYQSHSHLPEDERKVLVQRFYSSLPKSGIKKLLNIDPGKSTEEWVQDRADEKTQLAAELREVFLRASGNEKKAGHVEDRIAERAPGTEAEVNTLRAKLDQMKLRKGQTYHVPLSRGKGYAVIGDVGDHHAVKTVLGPNMRPPGERLPAKLFMDSTRLPPKIHLQKGDVILMTPKNTIKSSLTDQIISDTFKQIAVGLQGSHAHSGIYVGDGEIVEARIEDGVQKRTLPAALENIQSAIIVRPKTDKTTRQKAADFALSRVGRPYDSLAFLSAQGTSLLIPDDMAKKLLSRKNNPEDADKFICGNLVSASYAANGFSPKGDKYWDLTVPRDFLDPDTNKKVGIIGDTHSSNAVFGKFKGHAKISSVGEKAARAPRDYKREYAQYHAKPEQVENRSLRNQARRKLGLGKGDPREVDHKTPLAKGGGNGHANLRAVSRTTNRTKFTGDT